MALSGYYVFLTFRTVNFEGAQQDALGFQTAIFNAVPVIMLGLIMVAFEFSFMSKNKNVEESIIGVKGGKRKHLWYVFYTLVKLVFLISLLFFALTLILCRWHAFSYPDFFRYLAKSNFIYFFLLPIIGVLFGMVVSRLNNRLSAHILILVFYVFSSEYGISVLISRFFRFGTFFTKLDTVTRLLPRSHGALPLHSYGYPAENYLLVLKLFWICLLLFVLLLSVWRRQRTVLNAIATVLSFGLAGLLLFVHLQPASYVDKVNNPIISLMREDDEFYYLSHFSVEETPSFEISSYDMNLSIDRQLIASCSLTCDKPESVPFWLTLYRGYEVDHLLIVAWGN